MAKVVFRVDAGQILHVAMGHAFRCVSLAEDLRDRGEDVLFLMREDAQGNDFVRARGFKVSTIDAEADARSLVVHLATHNADVVVFDLLHVSEEETYVAREAGIAVAVIDDLGGKALHADLVVNGHILERHHHYDGVIGERLLGPPAIVLGRQFDGRRNHRKNEGLDEILVTMGGADPMGFTPAVVRALVSMNAQARITVVRGPAFGPQSDIKNHDLGMKTQVRVQEDVPDLSMLMVAADLVVAAGGRTAYELAATGTPGVLVPTAAHEVDLARALEAAGTVTSVSQPTEEGIRAELIPLVEEASSLARREEMAQAGRSLVDGRGRERVTRALIRLGRRSAGIGLGEI